MKFSIFIVATFLLTSTISQAGKSQKVEFKNNEEEKKVEIFVNRKFFTSFIYPDGMEKQSLYPIVSASGKTITRGYPLNPRPFERTDHPHHVGLWFNFGNVNGLDFWNNSFAIKPADKSKYGSVVFRKIVSENPEIGELVTHSDWVDVNNKVLINEKTTYLFSGKGNLRTIERKTILTAAQVVTFSENKEGLLGLRVDRSFETPATEPGNFLNANGVTTEVPVLNNEGVNGVYRNAEGLKGGDVWGKRSRWVALSSDQGGNVITIVMMDNPQNPNYPAWSHARGYGLFAINNLGGRVFDKHAAEVKVVLQPGKSIVFKHKVVIGGNLTDAEINTMAKNFK